MPAAGAHKTSFTTAQLAERLGGELVGRGDLCITGVNSLDDAIDTDITFIGDARHARGWSGSRAAAAAITEGLELTDHDSQRRALIIVPSADLACATLLELFETPEPQPDPGIHPTAVVHGSVQIGRDVRIGPHVSVDRRCVLGDGVVLHAGVRLYAGVEIHSGSVLHAGCSVRAGCRIGRNVVIHASACIGSDGFGYRRSAEGGHWVKMRHLGSVVIEDDVEVGSATCIDRAKFGVTTIGAGTKIDNLVQIGHNCRIGRHCVIAGSCALGGSVTLEDWVILAGTARIADHVTIGQGAVISAGAGIMTNVPPGENWFGYIASPKAVALREYASLRKLPGLIHEISRLRQATNRSADPSSVPDSPHAPDGG